MMALLWNMSQAFIVKPEVRRRQDGGELNPPLSS